VRMEVYETRRDDAAARIDGRVVASREVSSEFHNHAVGEPHVQQVVHAVRGVDDAAAMDEQPAHGRTAVAIK
jgi:hypothetical protein